MRNQAATTQSPAHLDDIPTGCLIDGSHMHPDDFSVAIIDYAKQFGHDMTDRDLVHYLLRTQEMQDHLTPEMQGESSATLREVSEEAINWLNDNVADEPFVFYIDESSLFLEDSRLLEMDGHSGPVYPERD